MSIMILSPYIETILKAACQPARDGETAALAPMGKYPGAECTRITGGGCYYVCEPQDLPQRVFSKSLTDVASKSGRPVNVPAHLSTLILYGILFSAQCTCFVTL